MAFIPRLLKDIDEGFVNMSLSSFHMTPVVKNILKGTKEWEMDAGR